LARQGADYPKINQEETTGVYFLVVLTSILASSGGGAVGSTVFHYDSLQACQAAAKAFSGLDRSIESGSSKSVYTVKPICVSGKGSVT
jgi:hypothetical protein